MRTVPDQQGAFLAAGIDGDHVLRTNAQNNPRRFRGPGLCDDTLVCHCSSMTASGARSHAWPLVAGCPSVWLPQFLFPLLPGPAHAGVGASRTASAARPMNSEYAGGIAWQSSAIVIHSIPIADRPCSTPKSATPLSNFRLLSRQPSPYTPIVRMRLRFLRWPP